LPTNGRDLEGKMSAQLAKHKRTVGVSFIWLLVIDPRRRDLSPVCVSHHL
jgi:hypothetical protein